MLLEEETDSASFESFDKALRADQLAGPGGVRLRKKVDQAIAEGRLEKDFRGEAGNHLRIPAACLGRSPAASKASFNSPHF